jgi:RNA polymerase sigma factor (sigma-70 family)
VARTGIPPFQSFLEEHGPPVYRFLVASAGPGDADDCFQETFLAALRAYPKLHDATNLRGWILTIASRKVIDSARSKRRRATPVADVTDFDGPSTDGQGDITELHDPLWEAVRELPDRQRIALVQRILLDRPYSELAAALNCSEETARAHVYQALKKLRRPDLAERVNL